MDGLDKPVQLLARADGVRHIVNMAAICALDAIRQNRTGLVFDLDNFTFESKPQVALLGRQNAPVTKPAHRPPNSRLAQPSIAYDEKP